MAECVARQAQQSCRQGSGQSHLLRAALVKRSENELEASSVSSPIAAPVTQRACKSLCFWAAFACPKIRLNLAGFAVQPSPEEDRGCVLCPAVGKAVQVAAARRELAETSLCGAGLSCTCSPSVTLWASLSDLPLSCGMLEQGESEKLHF